MAAIETKPGIGWTTSCAGRDCPIAQLAAAGGPYKATQTIETASQNQFVEEFAPGAFKCLKRIDDQPCTGTIIFSAP